LVNFANIAKKNNYTKPIFNNAPIIDLDSSRHPVIEKKVENFVNNDLLIHQDANMIIITGPNMGGKSTYMRQIAINTIMASIGSYVPAKQMLLGHIDQILTRIGASDNLSEGLSTFMVEMNECAKIINCATKNSLVIMDEVGRGTSSSDGEALAYSIAKYISKNIKCLTLFATHYLRVAELSVKNNKIKNKYTNAIEYDGGITFLYKMINGIAPKSYGIQVAELSGLPSEIISNAKELVETKVINSLENIANKKFNNTEDNYNRLKNKIKEIDIDKTTPIEALLIIEQLKKITKS
jgi:DNA mismatch repair protein MutS